MTKHYRTIHNMNVIEISLVTWPANPHCRIVVKGADGREVHAATEVE